MWTWCASTAADLAFYVILMTSHNTFTGQEPAWLQIATTSALTFDHSGHIPPVGVVLIFDVEAVDFSGNRSTRQSPLDICP